MDREETLDINSCLMMAMILETPIDLCYLFDDGDLKRYEPESHVTILYAPGVKMEPNGMLEEIETLLGPREFDLMMEKMESAEYFPEDWFGTIWKLGGFQNDDSDWLTLRLVDGDPTADWIKSCFKVINKGMKRKYGVESKFPNYTPHITLAELKPGTLGKYVGNDKLHKALSQSHLSWSDLVLSIGPSGNWKDEELGRRNQHSITTFNTIDRFFYLEQLRKAIRECKEELG